MAKCPFTDLDVATIRHVGPVEAVLESPALLEPIRLHMRADQEIATLDPGQKRALRRWIVEQQSMGAEVPIITFEVIVAHIHHREWPLSEKAQRLFDWLVKHAHGNPLAKTAFVPELPDLTRVPPADKERIKLGHIEFLEGSAASDAANFNELILHLNILLERGWIRSMSKQDQIYNLDHLIQVTAKGWLAASEPGFGSANDQAFIAMWFDQHIMGEAREAIVDAIRTTGYNPKIADREHYTGGIVDWIQANIRRSRFIVVDYTCAPAPDFGARLEDIKHVAVRGGVYYEAGYAEGLGLPVISTVRSDHFAIKGAVHFDRQHVNHIGWSTPDELRSRLIARIGHVIGFGPHVDPQKVDLDTLLNTVT